MDFTRGSSPQRFDAFQIAPMVDVVFILLSFFILATEFRLPERDFDMGYREEALPLGAASEDFPQHIPVELRSTGQGVSIRVGGARLADDDFDAIRAKLDEIRMPSISVLVKADPALSVGHVARALDAVLASSMKNVSVARLGEAAPAPGP